MCYLLLKIRIQIFYTPKAQNGGESPHIIHFLKSSNIRLCKNYTKVTQGDAVDALDAVDTVDVLDAVE